MATHRQVMTDGLPRLNVWVRLMKPPVGGSVSPWVLSIELFNNCSLGPDPRDMVLDLYMCHLDLRPGEVLCYHVSGLLQMKPGFPQVPVRPPARGGPGAPCLHVFLALALCSGRDPVLVRGLWCMAKANRSSSSRAPGVGAARIERGQDTRLSKLVAGDVHSPQGINHASNLCVIKARPLTRYAMYGWPSS
jgi:hypothetical protein